MKCVYMHFDVYALCSRFLFAFAAGVSLVWAFVFSKSGGRMAIHAQEPDDKSSKIFASGTWVSV